MRQTLKLKWLPLGAAISLALCLASALMWWRSCNHVDSYSYTSSPYKPAQHLFSISSCDGQVLLYFSTFYKPSLIVNGIDGESEYWSQRFSSSKITGARDHWFAWSSETRLGFSALFDRDEKGVYRHVYIPYYFFFLASAIASWVCGGRQWRISRVIRRSARGLCPSCAYDLRATRERCPECGWTETSQPPARISAVRGVVVVAIPIVVVSLIIAAILFWRIDSREHSLPVLSPDAVAARLKPGMSFWDFDELTREKGAVGQFDPPMIGSKGTDYAMRRLGDGINVVYSFQGPSADAQFGSFQVVHFSDLRPFIHPDLFDDVLLIHLSPPAVGVRFNAIPIIHAVNQLRFDGKARALRALREYEHLNGRDWERSWRYDLNEERVLLIVHLLFVRPLNAPPMASLEKGLPLPAVGPHPEDWPEYPLAIQDDIPFCIVDGDYDRSVVGESVSKVLDYCDQACSLRPIPLAPSSLPLFAADKLCASERWRRRFNDEAEAEGEGRLLRIQAMWAVTDLMRWHRDQDWSDLRALSPGNAKIIWTHLLHDERLRGVRWDRLEQKFTSAYQPD